MQTDRRAHPRFPLILAVQYLGAESVLDYTENLSAGGLFIRTDREFEAGERVTLVVSFPHLVAPVEITVEVLRTRPTEDDRPAGVAVRVPEDRPEDRARLAQVAAAVAGTRGPAPGVRLLLVEDNALVATMYTAALRRLGEADHLPPLGVEVAGDGAAALERLLQAPPIDVVVTDVYMPGVSGITLVERIRAEPALANTPVIVISSGGEAERALLASLGISAFLRKPVSYEDIAGAVRAILLGRAAQAQGGAVIPGGELAQPGLTGNTGVGTMPPDTTPASRRSTER
jgi:uncharacterized protein (TIGR02266 family)